MNWTLINFIAACCVLMVVGAIFLYIDTKHPALGLGSTPLVVVVIMILALVLFGISYVYYKLFTTKNTNNKPLSLSDLSKPGSGERKTRHARR